jgi:hypothetical protein
MRQCSVQSLNYHIRSASRRDAFTIKLGGRACQVTLAQAKISPLLASYACAVSCLLVGKIRVFSFRGEQDNATVRVVEASVGQAVYIHQGAYHLVENAADGQTKFLQVVINSQAMYPS